MKSRLDFHCYEMDAEQEARAAKTVDSLRDESGVALYQYVTHAHLTEILISQHVKRYGAPPTADEAHGYALLADDASRFALDALNLFFRRITKGDATGEDSILFEARKSRAFVRACAAMADRVRAGGGR